MSEYNSWLPEGYVLDSSEPALWILKRVDGSEVDASMVAAFLGERAGEALRRAVDTDVWGQPSECGSDLPTS